MNDAGKLNIQFDFHNDGMSEEPLFFSNPIEIISARNPQAVSKCLEQIDEAINRGYYAAGYMSYEALEQNTKPKQNTMPLLNFGIFQAPDKNRPAKENSNYKIGTWKLMESKETYEENFKKIIRAIKRGKTDEINYTVPFQASFSGDALSYYEQLKNAQQSSYCAYISMDHFDILSASPELFFHVKDEMITVRPMKGTTHRGLTYEADIQQKEWLQHSEKNKLENKLIIDLMREELREVTVPDSIRDIDTYRIETYPTVYQMTSGLTGIVANDKTITDILKALFPCSSIAGVPKSTGLKLIQTLESRPREVYCGATGYITPQKEAIFNVPIRTVWVDRLNETAHYGSGGAITVNSSIEEEFREVQTKTNVLTWKQPTFELLETIGLYEGDYFLLDKHLDRLRKSGKYFNFKINRTKVENKLQQVKNDHPTDNWRVRLTVDQYGTSHIEIAPLQKMTEIQAVTFATEPIDVKNRYLYHKTTHRDMYEKLQQHDIFDVLLWNEQDEVTEFTIGNLVLKLNGALYTPPVSSGLLPGTFREELLNDQVIQEKVLLKNDVKKAERIWLINSVRKWVEVHLINV